MYCVPCRWRGYKSKWGRDDWFDTNDAILSHETRGRGRRKSAPHTGLPPRSRTPAQLYSAAPDAYPPEIAEGDHVSPGPRCREWEAPCAARLLKAADAPIGLRLRL